MTTKAPPVQVLDEHLRTVLLQPTDGRADLAGLRDLVARCVDMPGDAVVYLAEPARGPHVRNDRIGIKRLVVVGTIPGGPAAVLS